MPTEFPRQARLPYLDHLRAESERFLAVLRDLPAGTRVPTCPEWDVDDLIWHLAEVQWFWGRVVSDRLVRTAEVDGLEPVRPAGRSGLVEFFEGASRELWQALTDTPPQTPAWSWSAEQTAGFSRRRQAHEALIHRLDAELTAEAVAPGSRTPLDPELAADGVDEVLRLMYGNVPGWAVLTPEPAAALLLRATDTGASWLVELGRLTGTHPGRGELVDRPGMRIAEPGAGPAPEAAPGDGSGPVAAATVAGTAADLDAWLWHRPPVTTPERTGDETVISRVEALISTGVN